ncbi:MAG: phosphatidylserine decarboxylase [Elusimicrobia bacterium]|nr:MAG: phosphatidylserine decarboxylase [Elusimicrobiota bacterium]
MRKEGLKFVLGGLGAALAGAGWAARGETCWLALSVLGVLFAAFCAYFFRDPDRTPPSDPALILSPGDGRVLTVAKEGPGSVTTVRIFLSVFDVHVQRLPCSGVVEKYHYQPGAFHMAMDKEARENERAVVTIRVAGRSETLAVEQIAGFVARRILTWVKPGDQAVAGERYGLIQFGSQAAVHLPESAEALVKPGDRVSAGLTPIARWR